MSAGPETIFKADGKNAIHDGIEHEAGGGKALLDPTDTAFLLLDHQSGLFQNVKDISVAELRANVTALAKVAALQRIPVITTASEPNGPNGPLMPEIQGAAPEARPTPSSNGFRRRPSGVMSRWQSTRAARAARPDAGA